MRHPMFLCNTEAKLKDNVIYILEAKLEDNVFAVYEFDMYVKSVLSNKNNNFHTPFTEYKKIGY